MIRLDSLAIERTAHWYAGPPPEQFWQQALVRRMAVRHDNERHAAVPGHGVEELLERIEAACGGTDTYYEAR
jgi:hypothetical protein